MRIAKTRPMRWQGGGLPAFRVLFAIRGDQIHKLAIAPIPDEESGMEG